MKISGRNIKRRLYDLRNLPTNIKRARYFRGHGVHSPFVYAIVREVFMASKITSTEHELHDRLKALEIPSRRAIELQNLAVHCEYNSIGIDCPIADMPHYQMVIATTATVDDQLNKMAAMASEAKLTLCIMAPYMDGKRQQICGKIIDAHPCTSIDNRGYLLLFNNHLPKQRFRL